MTRFCGLLSTSASPDASLAIARALGDDAAGVGVTDDSIGFHAHARGHGPSTEPSLARSLDGALALVLDSDAILRDTRGGAVAAGNVSSEGSEEHWLLQLYRRTGPRFVDDLEGSFRGFLVDRRARRVLLFNDRYGVGRLYLYRDTEGIWFATNASDILRCRPDARAFDPEGLQQYLAYGCTFGERTLFRGVTLLPPASCWEWNGEQLRQATPYFDPSAWAAQTPLAVSEFSEALRETLVKVVPKSVGGTERMGISLTAGLDTRMLMACLPHGTANAICFTYSGEDVDPLDARIASRIASTLGFQHHCLRIGPDFFSDFARLADETVYRTDGYFGINGAHEIYMSRLARQLAPIRLTGNYGSEILRGVSTLKPYSGVLGLLQPDLAASVRRTIADSELSCEHPVTFAAFREVPWNLYGNLAAGRSEIGFRTPYLDTEFVKLAYRGPASALPARRACMEVVRRQSPVLAAIPTDKGYLGSTSQPGAALRQAAAKLAFKLDYLNNEGFPGALASFDPLCQKALRATGLLGLHKHLHYRTWFRTKLSSFVTDRLTDPAVRRSPYWSPAALTAVTEDHVAGRRNRVTDISIILTLESIERQLLAAGTPYTSGQARVRPV